MKSSITLASKNFLKGVLVFAFWIAVWYLAALLTGQELLVPTPHKTFFVLVDLAKTGSFWLSVLFSTLRIVAGFLIGILIGTLGGYLSIRIKVFDAVFSPVLHIARAVPVVSFILLAYVWIKTDFIPVFITALMVAPIIWATTVTAARGIDNSLVEMGKVFGLSKRKIYLKIKVPQMASAYSSSVVTALGLAWKSGVAAEVICYPQQSIGRLLYNAKTYLETPETFALTLMVVVVSLILEKLMKHFAKRWDLNG